MDKAETLTPRLRPSLPRAEDADTNAFDKSLANGTKAISRATLILRLLARHEIHGVRLTHLTALTGIPHPTIRRVLKRLIDERLVCQDDVTRRYRLGPLNFELGLATLPRPEFLLQFNAMISRIAAACKDTTYLMVRSGADAVCLARVTAGPATAVTLEVGGRRPLGFGAAGLALLAQYSDDEVMAILEVNRREIEVHKRVSCDRILRRISYAREHGYALTHDITTMRVASIGVAICMADRDALFAVSVSSSKERMTPDRIECLYDIMKVECGAIHDLPRWPF